VNHFAATNKPIDASIPPSADSAFAVLRRRQTSTATLTPQVRHLHSQLHDADPVLARVIDARPDFDPRAWIAQLPPMDLYGALLFQIVGQQLSVAATWRTLERIQALLGGHLPVTTHCRSPSEKPSACWADGSAMFTIVASSTSIS
jgi:3-methyladenine DNA glycosylase/8-oxoguanine DNA glycosylase